MKTRHLEFLDNSISSHLAAIELYNKPELKHKDQIYVSLVENSWELLLQAKIVKAHQGNLESLYPKPEPGQKLRPTIAHRAFTLHDCLTRISLNSAMLINLRSLVGLREAYIHFQDHEELPVFVSTLAQALLDNYSTLCREWFGRNFSHYYVNRLTLGFTQYPVTLRKLNLKNKERKIQLLVAGLPKTNQPRPNPKAKVSRPVKKAILLKRKKKSIQTHKLTDLYPYSWEDLWKKLKPSLPGVTQHDFSDCIRMNDLKNNPDYAVFNFRVKKDEEDYIENRKVKSGTSSIYNEYCLKYLLKKLKKLDR
jgi:hypothetical protein